MTRSRWASVVAILGALAFVHVACTTGVAQDEVDDVGSRLDDYLTRATPFGFSGALLVSSEGEVLINKGYGLAIRSEGIPNTSETVFSIGSITKQFTAAAIMKLETMGTLSTEDPLGFHLAGVPEDKAGITLHHLLTHTSGLVANTGPDYEPVGRDEAVARALAEPLLFPPGESMSYSNAGYSLLAAVIEITSGLSYEEFLRAYLFEPADMTHTGYRLPDWSASTVAHWYQRRVDNGTPLEKQYPYWNLIGNGGILSTTGDMYSWVGALAGDRVLLSEAREKLLTPFMNDYAYGWEVLETDRGRLVQHDGGSDLGNSAELRWFVDEDVVIVLLCNQSYGYAPLIQVVRDEIETLAFGGDVEMPPATLPAGPERFEGIDGGYKLATGGDLRVVVDGASATIAPVGQEAVNLLLFQGEIEPGKYEDLSRRSNALVAAAVRGDSSAFRGEFTDAAQAARVHRFLTDWVHGLEKETGRPPIMANAMATVPGLEEDTVMTEVKLANDFGESRLLSFVWRDGRLVGFDQIVSDISMALAPVSETEFVAYNLAFRRGVPVTFIRGEDGSVVGLNVGAPDRARSAVRRHTHEHGDEPEHEGDEPGHDGESRE
jgi:CubicO group peptidase (beta-lactamase class C family)